MPWCPLSWLTNSSRSSYSTQEHQQTTSQYPLGSSSLNFNPLGVRRLKSGTAISPRQGLGRIPAYWNVRGLSYQPDTNLYVPDITSATDKAEIVSSFLTSQCGEGRMLGPFPPKDSTGVITSRMAVIPKKVTGKWSVMVDLSSPHNGHSVNDNLPAIYHTYHTHPRMMLQC